MPIFDTPEPINVTAELNVGDLTVFAEDRADTVVDVRPGTPGKKADEQAAENTEVRLTERWPDKLTGTGARLLIKTPTRFSLFGTGPYVNVTVRLPTGSHLRASTRYGSIRVGGRLGVCDAKSSYGDVDVEHAVESARLRSTYGDVTADRVDGAAEVVADSGELRVGQIGGTASVKNGNGPIAIGEVGGDLRISSSNGDIHVGRTHAVAAITSAHGSLRLDAASGGPVALRTSYGDVDLGIPDGIAAWLDARSDGGGNVSNELTPTGGPGEAETLEVIAHTGYGQITIRRAPNTGGTP